MIVCSCQGLTDHQVRAVCGQGGCAPQRPSEVHGHCGCSRQCGRCLRTIKEIMDELPPAAPLDADLLLSMEAAE
jgi:bacterioferritin-associated ferredoxin